MQISFKLKDGEKFNFNVIEKSFTIGRSQNCRIAIPSVTFSRQHCLVEIIDDEIFITDTGSSNGVYINRKRIPVNVPTPYKKKEHLSIGDAEVKFEQPDQVETVALQLGTQPQLELKQFKPKSYYNPVSARIHRKQRRMSKEEEDEKQSLLDPINLLVITLIVVGIFIYRQKAIKEVAPVRKAAQSTEAGL